MTKIITKNNLTKDYVAEQVNALSSTQDQVFAKIIQGLYQGKQLPRTGGLLTNLIKDLTQISSFC